MKKCVVFLMVFVFLFGLVACGTGNDNSGDKSSDSSIVIDSASELIDEILKKDIYKKGTYSMDCYVKTDDDKTVSHEAISMNMKGSYFIKEEIEDFSTSMFDLLDDSDEVAAGLYLTENTIYFMEHKSSGYKTRKMDADDYPMTDDYKSYEKLHGRLLLESAIESSYVKNKDKTYTLEITCDIAETEELIEIFDYDIEISDMKVDFETTESKVTYTVSEDFFITKTIFEFSQTAESLEITYTCKFENTFIGVDNTVVPPEGMDIESAEQM